MTSLKEFWDWFYSCREAYYYFEDFSEEEKAYYYSEMEQRLSAFHESVAFEIALPRDGGDAHLILTANAKHEGMLYVSNLVRVAPRIPKWHITSFIPARLDVALLKKDEALLYEFKGFGIDVNRLCWCPVGICDTTYKYDLLFGYLGLDSPFKNVDSKAIIEALSIILIDLLGEVYASQMIHVVYFDETLHRTTDWYKLETLPLFLESGEVEF